MAAALPGHYRKPSTTNVKGNDVSILPDTSVSAINSMTENEFLANEIRERVCQGLYIRPWCELADWERVKWLEAARAARRIVLDEHAHPAPRMARTVKVAPRMTLREKLAARKAGAGCA